MLNLAFCLWSILTLLEGHYLNSSLVTMQKKSVQNSFFFTHKDISACANVSIHLKSVCNHFSTKIGALMGKNNLETIAQNQNSFNLRFQEKKRSHTIYLNVFTLKIVIYIKQKAVTISFS